MLVSDLIKASARKLGMIASGEDLTTDEYADGLSALQSMLRSFPVEQMNMFASTKESFTLTAGQYVYTWGTGGDINSTRPAFLLGAYVLDSSGVSHPVDLISEGKYRSIAVKSTVTRPYAIFFHPLFPLANLYTYPVPDTAESMYIDSVKPFTETSSFSAISDTFNFPGNYEELVIYNLAIRLASEFGKAIPIEVAAIAANSYNKLIMLNSANQVEAVNLIVPASSSYGARYSINSDTYR